MPEGPSLVILKENITPFIGKTIVSASGSAKIDMEKIAGRKVLGIRTWGKLLFIRLKNVTLRIHLLMFGSHSVNEQIRADKSVRLHLKFKKGEIFFYTCSIRELEDDPDNLYDWEADVMSDKWNPAKARKKLKYQPDVMVCDALLDQQIFSGVGNIIKNEVLYRIQLHPETSISDVPPRKLTELINEARNYSFDFLKWKKVYQLKKHWLVYTKKKCKRDGHDIIKKYSGATKRRTFFCPACQVNYSIRS
jgi:endonuclease-8